MSIDEKRNTKLDKITSFIKNTNYKLHLNREQNYQPDITVTNHDKVEENILD